MKRFFGAIVALLLVFSVTACSANVQNEGSAEGTTDTTVAGTTIKETTTNSPDEKETEGDATTASATESSTTKLSAQDSTTKKTVTDIVTAKPVATTKRPVTTTKKPVTATKKPETTKTPSKKLPEYYPEAEIITLFNKINDYRAQKGLKKLTLDAELCKMAYARAEEQEVVQGHNRPDNSKYYSILDEYNYEYRGCGENIAYLTGLSSSVALDVWKTSSSHNGNMLDERWTKCGIALYISDDGRYDIVDLFAC